MLVALYLRGDPNAIPRFPLTLAAAVVITCLFGFGIGMINAVIQAFFSTWSFFFGIFLSPLYFLSGVFFIVEDVPQPFRRYLLYNPILQLVQWFRRGFYVGYSTPYFYPGYILWWTIAVLALGFTLVRLTRRKLLEVT
jgi:capsular polysaccharide transport system permease protein